ncbi:MAG: hypothetical protein LBD72_02340 [Puniceicoccales bacterium]|jgi:hypothetical protein|nr:hypothetical protein [Puniceicoccales bacterium]
MVNGAPPVVVKAPVSGDFSALAKTEINGLLDALCKLFRREIRVSEFGAYVFSAGNQATFARGFTTRRDLAAEH